MSFRTMSFNSLSAVAGFAFTSRCGGCNEPGAAICRQCRFALASAASHTNADGVMAALPFDGVVRQLLHALKYRNRRGIARQLATLMVRRLKFGQVDAVTWAPTSGSRARRRGYDQAELLARAVAHELGVPCRRLLYRSHGQAQTGRSRLDRLQGPSFRARNLPGFGAGSSSVLLIDDVVTTGATLLAARGALQAAGVGSVICAAAAATPNGAYLAHSSAPTSAHRSGAGLAQRQLATAS